MMLLMPFIDRFCIKTKIESALITLIILILLQGCSTLEDKENKSPENLDSLGQDIIDMVDIPAEEKALSSDLASIGAPQNGQNLYVDQAEKRLANVPKQVITQYQQALVLMKNQQWKKAEKIFDEILLSQPQLSGVYVNKALITFHKDDFVGTNEHLDNALTVNPINPYAHQLKGKVARLNGQFEQSEQSYLEALRIWPEYPEAQLNLAILLELYRGRLLDARKYYVSYLVLQPDDAQVQRWLAGVDIKIKRAGLSLPKKLDKDLSSTLQSNVSGTG